MLRDQLQASNPIPVAYRINLLANLFTGAVYRKIAASHGVARSEFTVIFCLSNLGELTAQDVVDITGRPKNSVSRAVNALLERGLVSRRTDPGNARRAPLSLTRAGKKLYDEVLPVFEARESALLSVLNSRERETLERLLMKLAARTDGWELSEADELS